MSTLKPYMQTYRQGRSIMPDNEAVFALKEAGKLDTLVAASQDPGAFRTLMACLDTAEFRDFRLYRKEKVLHIKYVGEQKPSLDYGKMSDREIIVAFLAEGNNVSFNAAKQAFIQAGGNYDSASRALEMQKNLGVEAKRNIRQEFMPDYGKLESCLREDAIPINEWADSEIIAANVFQATDAKHAVPPEQLEAELADIEDKRHSEAEEEIRIQL